MSSPAKTEKIVVLAGDYEPGRIIYHRLTEHFDEIAFIVERPVPRTKFLQRRLKRLGFTTVLGQVLFRGLAYPLLELSRLGRIEDIKSDFNLNDMPIRSEDTWRVESVNSEETQQLLRQHSPDVVVISCTRILRPETLACVDASFINVHTGVTPKYRGMCGGYWALVNSDFSNFGVTVHVVDEGIDTGSILGQKKIEVTSSDNFVTYPLLQLAEGLELLVDVLEQYFETGEMSVEESGRLTSQIWTHPTLWEYLVNRLVCKVK